MTASTIVKEENALHGATAAILRAAQRARRLAVATRTPLVIGKDGRVNKKLPEASDVTALRELSQGSKQEDFDSFLAACPDVPPLPGDER
ncbi:MAG: hypothetical protein WCL49_13385 [bacterium]